MLEFGCAFATVNVHGVPGENLLHFAGTIDHEDLVTIEQTIKEGCEKVNPDEWWSPVGYNINEHLFRKAKNENKT